MARNTDDKNASLGFEDKLWLAVDVLRNNMDPAEYKHVALGLIFLNYVSDAFEERRAQLVKAGDAEVVEDRDEYTAENLFWVPKSARWSALQGQARQPTIGKTWSGRPGRSPSPAPHRSGRAGFPHPALRITVSLSRASSVPGHVETGIGPGRA